MVACLDNISTDIPTDFPYTGVQSACSTGPAYANDAVFDAGPAESQQPNCVPRCGAHPNLVWSTSTGVNAGPSPTLEAVPSGACTYEGEACSMVAVRACCPSSPGAGLLFECHCTNLTWNCVAANASGAVACPAAACPVDTADAGDDGGVTETEDAGSDAGDAGGDAGSADAGDAGDAGDAATD